MGKKTSDDETEAPTATSSAPKAPVSYRCRVEASVRFLKTERSVRLGPGLTITADERDELVQLGAVSPDWFDVVEGEEG